MVLLILGSALSGCAGKTSNGPGQSPTDGTGTGSSPSTSPTGTGRPPGDPPNVTLPNLRFEECWGAMPTLDVPSERVNPLIPSDFEPDGPVPATGRSHIQATVCPRVVLPDETRHDVAILWSYVRVQPANDSWENQTLSHFTFDLLVSDDAVADALAAAGTTAEIADFESAVTPLGNEAFQATWTFSNERVTYTLTFQRSGLDPTTSDTYVTHAWHGTGPYFRVDVDKSFADYGPLSYDAGVVEVSGDSSYADLIGTPASPFGINSFVNLTLEIPARPVVFASST